MTDIEARKPGPIWGGWALWEPSFGAEKEDRVMSEHERRSCASKKFYAFRPPPRERFNSYSCMFCGGWHLTSKYKNRSGDVKYTDEGWPIVPVRTQR